MEYETDSEFREDFQSDTEPPIDKLIEKRLAVRGNAKVFKRILRLGERGFDKPAKCDLVRFRAKDVDAEPEVAVGGVASAALVAALVAELRAEPPLERQLGVDALPPQTLTALTTMKRGEVALFHFEEIEKDAQTRERRLQARRFALIEFIDGATIIDISVDARVFKIFVAKASNGNRIEASDRVRCALTLRDSALNELCAYKTPTHLSPRELAAESPFAFAELPRLIEGMKESEIAHFEFDGGAESVTALLQTHSIPYRTKPRKLYLSAHISEVRQFSDLFFDGGAFKSVERRGEGSAKAAALSRLYFDFAILVDEREIFSTFAARPTSNAEFEFARNGYYNSVLHEYAHSKALEKALQRMNKGERARLTFANLARVRYGADFEALRAAIGAAPFDAKRVEYKVELHFFGDAKSAFIFGADERLEHIRRKRGVIARLIEGGEHRRALKVVGALSELCRVGVFAEESAVLAPFRLGAALNASLCHWKLGNWAEMAKSAREALAIDRDNEKAIYRLCVAELEAMNYESVLAEIEKANRTSDALKALTERARAKLTAANAKERRMFSRCLG